MNLFFLFGIKINLIKMSFKNKIINDVVNSLGWKSKRKIVVFESDDWGMTRMPSKNVYSILLQKGYSVDKCPYNTFDSLENNEDLEKLIAVLLSVKDAKGNPVKFTLNNIVANPDFDKIRDSGYEKYYYEPFNETLKKYSNTDRVMPLYKEGLEKNVFKMQFHGREHLNINRWLYELQNKNKSLLEAFENRMYSLPNNNSISGRRNFLDAFGHSYKFEYESYKSIINSGTSLFSDIWGYDSATFIAPCYTWHPKIEEDLKEAGIIGFQGNRVQRVPVNTATLKVKRRYHYLGQQNKLKQIYLTRNVNFEPFESQKTFSLAEISKDIEAVFKYNIPVIIGSHRANYIGRINPKNRDENLKLLKQLLEYIVSKYKDVEFMSSDELVKLIQYEKRK